MPLIIIIIMAVYLVLIAWTWNSLENIEKTKKIAVIAIGVFLTYIITLIIFSISKAGIDYGNIPNQSTMKNILVILFTGINGIVLLPYVAKILGKINENEIEKDVVKRKIVILIIVFMICMFFECGYLKDTQKGMINIYNSTYKQNNVD